MSHMRFRSAIAPVRRSMESYQGNVRLFRDARRRPLSTVMQTVLAERPDVPLFCLRPQVATETARRFVECFPGHVLYAVKCNNEPAVLRSLWAGGIRHFDCASVQEVRLVRGLFPDAHIHFMHPVKSRAAIGESWDRHSVRDFVIDSAAELDKVLEETAGHPGRLGIVVRLALPKGGAVYDLSGKFGAEPLEAARLLRLSRTVASRIGLSFHVGSQCLDPEAWVRALDLAGQVIALAGIELDILDIGGGFPVAYPDVVPPPFDDFMARISRGLAALALPATTEVWCEPGRALVAPCQSIVVRIEARRGDALYINDGIYGSLSDAGVPAFRFPCRLIRADGTAASPETTPYMFYGPTCDSADRMNGPFHLPTDAREGDWIEIGQLGAYGTCLRTAFNGFDEAMLVEVCDRPLLETPGYLPVEVAA